MARTFAEAAGSDRAYVVVHGALHFDAAEMPRTGTDLPAPEGRRIAATIEGKGLTDDGFTVPFVRDLTLDAQCIGAWCASAEPGVDVLAFVERDGENYALTLTPCGGMAFQDPAPEDIERTVACYQNGACDVSE